MNETFAELVRGLDGVLPDSSGIRRPQGGRRAGVLILFTDEADPSVTVIERATTLRRHAGQVAFPGGAMEDTDATVVDARASDALALAARTSCPIRCAAPVLDEAGLVLSADGELREQSTGGAREAEAQVREFRDFLDNVDPEDFQS